MTREPGASLGGALPPLGPAVSRSAPSLLVPLNALLPPFAAGPAPAGHTARAPEWRGHEEPAVPEIPAAPEAEPVPDDTQATEDDVAPVPSWMTWDEGEEAEELGVLLAAPDEPLLLEAHEPSAAHPEERADGEDAAAEPAAEPPVSIRTPMFGAPPAVDPSMGEIAERLERIAATLRATGISGLAGGGSTDPLALLVTGFALGSLQRPREN